MLVPRMFLARRLALIPQQFWAPIPRTQETSNLGFEQLIRWRIRQFSRPFHHRPELPTAYSSGIGLRATQQS
jgi:hypothetical protein